MPHRHNTPINLCHLQHLTTRCSGFVVQRTAFQQATQPITILVVLALAGLVHFVTPSSNLFAAEAPNGSTTPESKVPASPKEVGVENSALPKNVAEMREALLAATQTGRISELLTPYEWNELPPAISDDKIDDPIAYWKRISSDGEGIEVLAILSEMLRMAPAKLHVGPDFENSALYVWPYLAEHDLAKLSPAQQVELRALVPADVAKAILTSKRWTWWRLAIGADGTWHSFMKHER
ncbi:MAG: hypothetical protein K0U34_07700 [Alphaproteobacteria bacterium]|nr:hypothetical protein [Alphaproteobacteria bacterium]